MPFSTTERSKIRQYLGYDDRSAQVVSTIDPILDDIESDDEATSIVQDFITRLDAVNVAINTSSIGTAGIESADNGGVAFYEMGKINDLKVIGRTLVNQLSIKTGISIAKDFFGSSASSTCALKGLSQGFW